MTLLRVATPRIAADLAIVGARSRANRQRRRWLSGSPPQGRRRVCPSVDVSVRATRREGGRMHRDLHGHHRPQAGRGGAAGERGAVPRHVRERGRRHRPHGPRRPLAARQRDVLRPSSATPARSCSHRTARTSPTPTTCRQHRRVRALLRGEHAGYTLEKRYIRKDGSAVWVQLAVSLQRDAAGKPAYAIAVIQDISERKQLEEELRQAKEAAEAANRAKDEFLANVSHEIRTPMNAILGMTELVLETPLTEDQRQCLRTVKSAADNLLGIINDLLDFSKIEAGKLELDPADFSLRAAVGDTCGPWPCGPTTRGWSWSPRAAGRARRPGRRRGPAAAGAAQPRGQRHQVHRCGRGGRGASAKNARATALRRLRRRSSRPLHFTVRDTGIGIPPEQAGAHFPGLRAGGHLDHAQVRRHWPGPDHCVPAGGSHGRDDHRGQQPGRGSTFAFTARFGQQPHPAEPVSTPPPGRVAVGVASQGSHRSGRAQLRHPARQVTGSLRTVTPGHGGHGSTKHSAAAG